MRRSVPRPHAARTLPWSMTRARLPGSEVSISMPLTHVSTQHVQRAKTPSVVQAIAHESERPGPLRLHVHRDRLVHPMWWPPLRASRRGRSRHFRIPNDDACPRYRSISASQRVAPGLVDALPVIHRPRNLCYSACPNQWQSPLFVHLTCRACDTGSFPPVYENGEVYGMATKDPSLIHKRKDYGVTLFSYPANGEFRERTFPSMKRVLFLSNQPCA